MKTEILKIRLTEEEKEIIRAKANKAGLTMTAYTKKMLLNGEVKSYDKKLLHELKMQIRYIGNNINQAVRIMNMYHDTNEFEYVYRGYLKLKDVVEKKLK